MPSITQLIYILAVDQFRHFGKAADHCRVAQPSLSAQILAAEKSLGYVIFDRGKKPVVATDVGKQFIKQARVVVREHNRLKELAPYPSGLSGTLNVGIIPTLAPYLLPLFLEPFLRRFPDVSLSVSELKRSDIVSGLHLDRLDIGLLATPLGEKGLTETTLFKEPFYVFAPDGHPLCECSEVGADQLNADRIWLLEEGHCFRDQALAICGARSVKKDQVAFNSGSIETLINLVRTGRGYTILPYLATIRLTSLEKRVNLRPFRSPVPGREISAVVSRAHIKRALIDQLVRFVLSVVPPELKDIGPDLLDIKGV